MAQQHPEGRITPARTVASGVLSRRSLALEALRRRNAAPRRYPPLCGCVWTSFWIDTYRVSRVDVCGDQSSALTWSQSLSCPHIDVKPGRRRADLSRALR